MNLRSVGYWPPLGPEGRAAVEEAADPGFHGTYVWRACRWYARRPQAVTSWRGYSTCRLCGVLAGTRDHYRDDLVWPEGYAHYVEAHAVRPPPHFIAAALAAYEGRAPGDDDLYPPRPGAAELPNLNPDMDPLTHEPPFWRVEVKDGNPG